MKNKPAMSNFCSRKFTLIEMLVVVAIIGILASMMMPSLHNAIDSARSMSCQNNLKQIYLADGLYMQDNGWLVPGRVLPSGNAWDVFLSWWQHKLRGYAGYDTSTPSSWSAGFERLREGVFLCPSMEKIGSGTEQFSYAQSSFNYISQGTFNMTPRLEVGTGAYAVRPDSRSSVAGPSKILLIGELGSVTGSATGSLGSPYIFSGGDYNGTGSSLHDPNFLHAETKNTLFLDGHVSPVVEGEVIWQLYVK